jgi:hypothetical protein
MSKWLLSAAGGASMAAGLLWQPPFYRELVVCGLIAMMVAAGGFLKELGDRQ